MSRLSNLRVFPTVLQSPQDPSGYIIKILFLFSNQITVERLLSDWLPTPKMYCILSSCWSQLLLESPKTNLPVHTKESLLPCFWFFYPLCGQLRTDITVIMHCVKQPYKTSKSMVSTTTCEWSNRVLFGHILLLSLPFLIIYPTCFLPHHYKWLIYIINPKKPNSSEYTH